MRLLLALLLTATAWAQPLVGLPKGPVKQAVRQVSLTFTQPKWPLGKPVGEAPARITPAVPGHWRWLGTRTVVFESDAPFPPDTQFTVEVSSSFVTEPVSWGFTTPGALLVEYGVEGQSRRPLIWLCYKPPVSLASIFPRLELTSAGLHYPLELTPKGVRPRDALPLDASFELRGAGKIITFRTPGPVTLTNFTLVGKLLKLSFSADLDPASNVTVTPDPGDLQARVKGSELVLTGNFQSGTLYSVTSGTEARDRFGRPVSGFERKTKPVEVPSPRPLSRPEPIDGISFTGFAINASGGWVQAVPVSQRWFDLHLEPGAEAEIREVQLADWEAFEKGRWQALGQPLGRTADTRFEFPQRPAHLLIVAGKEAGWLQVTNLRLTAWNLGRTSGCWVTSREDGHPLPGVTVDGALQPTDASGLTTTATTGILVARQGSDTTFVTTPEAEWYCIRNANDGRVAGWVRGGLPGDTVTCGNATSAVDAWGGSNWTVPHPTS